MTTLTPDFDLPDTMALRPVRRPTVSDADFRAAMSGMASTVHVVTARRGEERIGRTVTSVLSLSAATCARRLQGGAGGRPAVPVLWIGTLCTGQGGFSRGQPLSPPIPVFADEFPMPRVVCVPVGF